MLKNFFITTVRNLLRNKAYLIINVLGLAIGLTSFIFISLYVLNELSYDRFHSKSERIFRVKVKGQMSGQVLDQAVTAAPMAAAMIADYPEVEQTVRIARFGAWLVRYKEKGFNEDNMLFADSSFFDVFDFKLLRGNPQKALLHPKSVVLTETTARRYFGDEDPMGKTLSVESDTVFYTVTGIMQDVPVNSHMHFDMMASLNTLGESKNKYWVSHNYYTYIVLKKGADVPAFEKRMDEMVVKYVGPQLKQIIGISLQDFKKAGSFFGYQLQPLTDIHLKSNIQVELEANGKMAYVRIFSIIAILILLVAIINFVNLATAKSSARAKEVGIRKTLGSTRLALIYQFLGESVVLAFIAAFTAGILVALLTPGFYALVGTRLSVSLFSGISGIFLLIALALVVGIIAGIYPAFVLASFKPITVLKGSARKGAKPGLLRSVLVVTQFIISITIIIGTIVIYRQLNYMQNKDLGFDKEQLVIVRRPDALKKKIESFKQELLTNPNISGVANASSIPGRTHSNNGFLKEDDPQKNTFLLMQNRVSFEYAQVLGLKLVEGRLFSREYGTDSTAIIINETAAKALGLTSPLGKNILEPGNQQFIKRPIIGVVKDFNLESLHNKIAPACLTIMYGNQEGYMLIRLKTKNIKETIGFIEDKWKSYTASQPFQYFFFDEDYQNLYKSEAKSGQIFIIFACLAIFIACLGLLGLITYTATVRTKEIGIRKVLGAGIPGIVGMLSTEVIRLIFIATFIAWPIAWFATNSWLENFADRIEVGPFVYVFATLIALFIGLVSISFQAIKAAMANPVNALKYE